MSLLHARKIMPRRQPARLEDFEEKLMFGDLAQLLQEMEHDRHAPEDLVRGLESLKHFRDFYHAQGKALDSDSRARVATYDAAWCMELIEMAARERGVRHYRA
ncbi:MAG: hypothetical protein GC131_07990 [Alphaproteobacteria bacterium]|nr:hypothetical protein [Alphaproteobacteria bacterium]